VATYHQHVGVLLGTSISGSLAKIGADWWGPQARFHVFVVPVLTSPCLQYINHDHHARSADLELWLSRNANGSLTFAINPTLFISLFSISSFCVGLHLDLRTNRDLNRNSYLVIQAAEKRSIRTGSKRRHDHFSPMNRVSIFPFNSPSFG
jgi:hypothetical protein